MRTINISVLALAVLCCATGSRLLAQKPAVVSKGGIPYTLRVDKNISDFALVDLVQKQTLRYFWDFAHPASGIAREGSNQSFNYGQEVVTAGGTVLE